MDRKTYLRVVREIVRLVGDDVRRRVEEAHKKSEAADIMTDAMREAVRRSSVHAYNDSVYAFNGRCYEKVEKSEFYSMVYDAAVEAGLPLGCRGRTEMMAKHCERVAATKELEVDNSVVVFRNCVLDLDTMTTHEFNPAWKTITALPYDYDPTAYPHLWHTFLDRVLPSADMQRVLQQFLGCVFVNRRKVSVERMCILLGNGANGKSVVHRAVCGVLGDENVTPLSLDELIYGSEAKKNMMFINGMRLNYSSEIGAVSFGRNYDKVKRIISGEPVVVRGLFMNNFTMRDIPMMMSNANTLPRLTDLSEGMRRRFLIIPFEVEIPPEAQNKHLSDELKAEYSGIFNWIIEGREMLKKNHYVIAQTGRMKTLMEEYEADSSNVMAFMMRMGYRRGDRDVTKDPIRIPSGDLYRQYIQYCLTNGITVREQETHTMFGSILRNAGFTKKPHKGKTCYLIWTDNRSAIMAAAKREGLVVKRKIEDKPFVDVKDGRKWVKSRQGLARALAIPEDVVQRTIQKGLLADATRIDGTARLYDIDKCRDVIIQELKKANHKAGTSLEAQRNRERTKNMNAFNQRMKAYGEPYRKYNDRFLHIGVPEGIVPVPYEWDYFKEIPRDKWSPIARASSINPETIIYDETDETELYITDDEKEENSEELIFSDPETEEP